MIGDGYSFYQTDDPQIAEGLRTQYIAKQIGGVVEVSAEELKEKKKQASARQSELDSRKQSLHPINQFKAVRPVQAPRRATAPAAAAAGVRPRLSTVIPDDPQPGAVKAKIAAESNPEIKPSQTIPKAEPLPPGTPLPPADDDFS